MIVFIACALEVRDLPQLFSFLMKTMRHAFFQYVRWDPHNHRTRWE